MGVNCLCSFAYKIPTTHIYVTYMSFVWEMQGLPFMWLPLWNYDKSDARPSVNGVFDCFIVVRLFVNSGKLVCTATYKKGKSLTKIFIKQKNYMKLN